MRTIRLRITLRDVAPSVVRVVDVPAAATLAELHHVLQAALGWTDSHLHQFVTDGATYGVPDEDGPEGVLDESGVRLRDLPDSLTYLYDLGDRWEHERARSSASAATSRGASTARAPARRRTAAARPATPTCWPCWPTPAHEDHDEMRRWAGERPDFDQARTDRQVRQAVGEVPASVRLVLDLTAGGVKLTPGGRLPRALVRQVQEQRPHWYPLDRPASVEEDLLPLAVLHDLMRSVGLLRLAKGVLTPTRAAADDVEVVRRLRSWFVPGAFLGAVAELVVAELAARGPQHGDSLARQVHSLLGRGWFRGAEPVTDEDLLLAVAQMAAVMQGLDLIEVDEPVWRPGPSVLSLLPRATLLARVLGPRTDADQARLLTR